ncbi:HAD-like domain-containing protein [Baffinella frigidus]|nr:HAD-like domain-containing protein [Cryptophyta sp. CCMP2293]
MGYRRSDTSRTSLYDAERIARGREQLDKSQCYLLDMDQTLARYRTPAVYELVHRALLSFMVDNKGYPAALKEVAFEPGFCLKGLVFDTETGDVLKIDEHGAICRARHGFAAPFLTQEQVKAKYPGGLWPKFQKMVNRERGDFFLFNTLFDVPVALVCARLVDNEDASRESRDAKGHQAAYAFLPHLFEALEHTYGPPAFGERRGLFFPSLLASPSTFLWKRPRVTSWLQAEKAKGRNLFLVTNSQVDFSEFIMQESFGADWRALFDGIVFFARKGKGFFELPAVKTPFFRLKNDTRGLACGESVCPGGGAANELGEAAPTLEMGGEYLQGHHSLMSGWLGHDPSNTTYFGDHLMADVKAVRDCTSWQAVAVVSELRAREPSEDALGATWGDFFSCDSNDAAEQPGGGGGVGGGAEGGGGWTRSFLGSVAEDLAVVCLADMDDLCPGFESDTA